jgi:glutathione peroxidase
VAANAQINGRDNFETVIPEKEIQSSMSKIYEFNVEDAKGNTNPLSNYAGKVMLVVNTASQCGFTPQYKDLQELHNEWHDKGLEILAFPCNQFGEQEPGGNDEIQEFCQINYGLSFPVFAKIDVNGSNAHPLFEYLRAQQKGPKGDAIRWNFTKFLVDQNGNVLKRYESNFAPKEIGKDIEGLLQNNN